MRKRRRVFLAIVLLLVGGIVVNVGGAWILAEPQAKALLSSSQIPDPPTPPGRAIAAPWVYAEGTSFGASKRWWFWSEGSERLGSITHRERGWPMRSLECIVILESGTTISSHDCAYIAGRYLPFRPLWPGFAINTIFYALVLALPWVGLVQVRRIRRARRGACAPCGYDLSATPDGMACPECGSTRAVV